MEDVNLPPCGLYRTTADVGGVPAGRLVYFHNHGDPGAGVYLPERWENNRAVWSAKGHTLPDPSAAAQLEALEPEGFYRVTEPFHCCEKECRRFDENALVQLGYDGSATPILFTPEMVSGALAVPERGVRIDRERIGFLQLLKVPVTSRSGPTH